MTKTNEYKFQHFVPKCHLRPFSTPDTTNKSIALYNLKSNHFVAAASLEQQCGRNYFYSDHGELEHSLSNLEGLYAHSLRNLEAEKLSSADGFVFKTFSLLQYFRTSEMVRRYSLMGEAADILLQKRFSQVSTKFSVNGQYTAKMLLLSWIKSNEITNDLDIRLIRNQTEIPFITSDNPSVVTNRFISQKLKMKNMSNGLSASGLTLFLPLSPKYLLMLFDSEVYQIEQKAILNLSKKSDVHAINHLQYLNCEANLYFSSILESRAGIEDMETKLKTQRKTIWHRFHLFTEVPDSDHPNSQKYVRSGLQSLPSQEKSELLVTESLNLNPSYWPSFLKCKIFPKYVCTETGAGIVRPGVYQILRSNTLLDRILNDRPGF